MEFRLNVVGFKDLMNTLHRLPDEAFPEKILLQGVMDAGRPIVDMAKARVRVRTGKLRDSIGIQRSRRSMRKRRRGKGVEAVIGPRYPEGAHGHLVEFGTKARVSRPKGPFAMLQPGRPVGRTRPQPFMRPALDHGREPFFRNFAGFTQKRIDRAVRRLAKRRAA